MNLEAVPSIAQAGLPVPAIGFLMVALLAATLSTGGGVTGKPNVIANDIVIGCACRMLILKKLRINKIRIIIAAALLSGCYHHGS